MPQEEKKDIVFCCVINCKKEISVEDAISIGGNYFCKTCGVAYYRSTLNL